MLQPYVHHYWILKSRRASMSQIVMPMTCMKWMFHRKRPFFIDGITQDSMKATIVGVYDKAIRIQSHEEIELVVVFFQPYASKTVMNIPCQEFAYQSVDIDDIGVIEFHDLKSRILDATTTEECIGIIENFILSRLIKSPNNVYLKPMAEVFSRMNANPEVKVNELAHTACLSERQLRRVFVDQVGMRPKQIQRMMRFQQAVKAMLSSVTPDIESLIYKYGYLDHSHFNHEFHEISGLSPTEYLKFLKHSQKEDAVKAYRSYYDAE
jgi:AraC-like DNA-binding protein